MIEGIVKNNSNNGSFINEDDKMYENDPTIFNKETKTIRMLSCKIPNAFIYARNFQKHAIGYVKVVSNSMGPSDPPAWQIAGKKYVDGEDKKESTYCICDCINRNITTTVAPAPGPTATTTGPAAPSTTTLSPTEKTSIETTTTKQSSPVTTALPSQACPDIPQSTVPCRMLGPSFNTNEFVLKQPCKRNISNNNNDDAIDNIHDDRGMKALQLLVKIMHKDPVVTYQIEGHTDEVGDEAANVVLGKKRAEQVLELMLTIAARDYSTGTFSEDLKKRLETVSYGETRPLVSNQLIDGRANKHGLSLNRRVEFLRMDNKINDQTCEEQIIGSCVNLQYGKKNWKPNDYDDDVMERRCRESSGDGTGGDVCIYATQDEENRRLNQYLLLNMFNGQGDEPNVIISEEMNDVLQSNIDLKRPRLCYAKNAKCNPSIPEETTVECDFCNMVSPEIKFKKGSVTTMQQILMSQLVKWCAC